MPRASISQGIQRGWCCFNLALKKPANSGLLLFLLVMYIVAPIPEDLTAPSVTIHSWSDGLAIVIDFVNFRLSLAALKLDMVDSDQEIFSVEARPAVSESSGAMIWLPPLITLLRALYAPINDRNAFTVFGASHFVRGDT